KQGSPGYVRHYYLDFSDSLGSEWDWDGISRRLGHSYYLDFQHVAEDFVTFGVIERPWERAHRNPGAPLFGYFTARDFEPDDWRAGYPNPAFSRMSERDGAWMARILSRISREDLRAVIALADFTVPEYAQLLEQILWDRLRAITARYFSRLSPLANVEVQNDQLCAIDLARHTRIYPLAHFQYGAHDDEARTLPTQVDANDRVCVQLAHVPGYRVIEISNGATPGTLRAHMYDLGKDGGYQLVGIERDAP
ncbi:MAG TPA: hypothetical protein VHZ95_09405, partial [Polyangiales bacterium]|nr:hypothetical protein [Polyangiales bacterium]